MRYCKSEFLNFLKMFYNEQKKKKKVGKKVELRTTVVVVNTVYDEKDNVGARGSGPLNQCALYS